ncbi:MAG: response regulator [Caldilineaceae bacterium]|nr:response regulator [Caldilineaceae bacterium]MBP8125572.1 response regulator [Caldilineaceae bacterium]
MIQNHGTILIVDDEPFGRETLKALLGGFGYTIHTTNNGHEALAMVARHAPDLLLLDVMMAGMDGFEVCEKIRLDPKLAEIPIVMVTALDDRASRLRGIEAGADDFISKPFDRVELRARVKTILRLNRYRRIRTERTKFEWVVEQADQGYLILDETDHIQYMNTQARLLLGGDFQGQPEDLPVFTKLVQRQYLREPATAWENWPRIDSTASTPTERYLVRPETATALSFWLSVDVISLPQGADAGILVRLRNVSAQVGMVREQRTFHALIQHRLRTPITLMLGSLDIVSHQVAADPDLFELVQIAQRGAERIHGDIEEILAYLKASSVQMAEMGMPLSNLPTLVDSCAKRLGLYPIITHLPTLDGTEPTAIRIVMAPRFVELILLELLQNARKFHPRRVPLVQVTATLDSDGLVHLFVRDDGVHLDPDQLGQAWRPYFQGEKGFSGQMDGWGLGLSTVASLVWGVGGSCRLGNRADRTGVEVELTLPTVA